MNKEKHAPVPSTNVPNEHIFLLLNVSIFLTIDLLDVTDAIIRAVKVNALQYINVNYGHYNWIKKSD